jgi:hypothetical protein
MAEVMVVCGRSPLNQSVMIETTDQCVAKNISIPKEPLFAVQRVFLKETIPRASMMM